jgi:scyllo-inositol 2-dehydrogenase (NADP+)
MILNVALVGYGLSGRYLQAPFFEANPTFRLKTIVTNSQNPQENYPTVTIAKTLEDVINDTTIDVISICSPNVTHYDYAKKCLLANKHVLVEKPFTATIAEAEELIKLAQKQGKVLYIFQNRRFDGDFLTIKKIIDSRFLGELLSFESHMDRFKPTLNAKKWKEIVSPSNGILYDLGSHLIDQAVALFGKPARISGETFSQRENSEIDDAFDIRLDYGKLKVTIKSSLLVREDSPRFILHGTKGSFIKYGVDVQEDQLKAGILPQNAIFGKEEKEKWGVLNTDINELHFLGKIETETGNWATLFQNLYETIAEEKEQIIKTSEVLEQLHIIENIKKQAF